MKKKKRKMNIVRCLSYNIAYYTLAKTTSKSILCFEISLIQLCLFEDSQNHLHFFQLLIEFDHKRLFCQRGKLLCIGNFKSNYLKLCTISFKKTIENKIIRIWILECSFHEEFNFFVFGILLLVDVCPLFPTRLHAITFYALFSQV